MITIFSTAWNKLSETHDLSAILKVTTGILFAGSIVLSVGHGLYKHKKYGEIKPYEYTMIEDFTSKCDISDSIVLATEDNKITTPEFNQLNRDYRTCMAKRLRAKSLISLEKNNH